MAHRTQRRQTDYQSHTQLGHIRAKPDMYIGNICPMPRDEWILTAGPRGPVMQQVTMDLPEAMVRLYLEVVSNAADNSYASRQFDVDPGGIEVTMDAKRIIVRSGGEPIPVVPDQEYGTLPDMIFGKLLTSSNYDPNIIRMGCGTNGLGAKLTNAMSTLFSVKVGDPKRGQQHTSTWANGMTTKVQSLTVPGWKAPINYTKDAFNPPAGEPYRGPSYVEVAFDLDFAYFKMPQWPASAYGLFARLLLDFGLACKIPVSFNGTVYDVRSIRNYAALYFQPKSCETAILHHEWEQPIQDAPKPGAAPNANWEKKISTSVGTKYVAKVEICILDTPGTSKCLSFVNGLMTPNGGVHVDEAYKAICDEVLKTLLPKPRALKSTELKTPKLTAIHVKPHVSIILSCRLPNPGLDGQTKTKLTRPRPDINLAGCMGQAKNWELISTLKSILDSKYKELLTKTDGKNKRHIKVDAGEDANEAGGPGSEKCVFSLVEGNSAASYVKKRNELMGGKDYNGYLPLRGKFLNVNGAPPEQIAENREICRIKEFLGLREDMDYRVPENKKTLRYGFILILADADSDGSHIKTLLLNYFHCRFPSIIAIGMFGYLMTPVVRCFQGNAITQRFYTQIEYDKWKESNLSNTSEPKYYKGLGSSAKEDIKDDLNTAPVVTCIYDDKAPESMDLAFNPKRAADRRVWINKWRDVTAVNDVYAVGASTLLKTRDVTRVIDVDLVAYTIDALFRAIPSYRDGLKLVQRQIMNYALHHWGKGKMKTMKVSDFAHAAANACKYHHGDMSDAIIKLAQNFVGSNNLNYLYQDGQFGTRDELGKDAAAPRYPSTRLEEWVRHAYPSDLISIVPHNIVEGEEVESQWLPCVIPMHIINGARGVATGWATYIPPHSPQQTLAWIISKCTGRPPVEPVPWFRGFKGSLSIITNGTPTEPQDIPEESQDDPVLDALIPGKSLRTEGIFRILATREKRGAEGQTLWDVEITELPIGQSILGYKAFLLELRTNKALRDVKDKSSSDFPHYIVYDLNFEPTIASLRLRRSYGLNNMILVDDRGYPTTYRTASAILEVYYASMLALIQNLIRTRITNAENKIELLQERIRFVSLVLDGTIVVQRVSKKAVHVAMDQQVPPIAHAIFDDLSMSALTLDGLDDMHHKIKVETAKIAELKVTRAEAVWLEWLKALIPHLPDDKTIL